MPPQTPAPTSLAQRAEQCALLAAQPPHDLEIGGWLLYATPGPLPMSGCINALRAGDSPWEDVFARCLAVHRSSGQSLLVRITPWTQPPDLDARLAAQGWRLCDPADVLVLRRIAPGTPGLAALQPLDAATFAATIGALRGLPADEIAAHAGHLATSVVPYHAFRLNGPDGALLACGQVAVREELAGLYDILSVVPRQGHGERLCRALLVQAHALGARQAYLQVRRDNLPAQRLYARLGFRLSYGFHYRDPGALAA